MPPEVAITLALRRPAPPVALTTRRWLFAAALAPLLGLRLYHLHRYVLRGDEGVYLESLLLMARGYLPFRDFFCSQGPLFLPLLYPFTLLGSGVFWPRLGVVLYTLVGLLAAAALGRRLGGPVAGVASLVVLGLSPNLLFVSRLTLAEGPALGLATAAVWLATRAPARPWLAGSAAMLAAALLVKPMLAPAGLAVLALALAPRLRARAWGALAVDLALMAAVALLVLAVVVAPFGIANVLDQLVAFHTEVTRVEQRGRLVGGWDNLASALPKLADEGPGLYALGTVGLLLALRARQALGLGVILWLLGTAALLWIYVPFYDRYLAFLLPPLALLAGLAVAAPFQPRHVPGPPRALAALAALLFLATLPGVVTRAVDVAEARWEPLRRLEYQAAVDLAAQSAPDAFVATDNQSVAYMAGRSVPPPLVDTSEARVTSGSLKTEQVLRALDEYRVDALVWWSSDRFGKLRGLQKQLDASFQRAIQYDDDRALWLRRGAAPVAGTPPAADEPGPPGS